MNLSVILFTHSKKQQIYLDINLHLIYLPVFVLCKVDDECDNVNEGGEGAGLFFPLDHDPRRWVPGFEPEHPD